MTFKEDPTVVLVFVAQTSTLEYLFEIWGKNIGQPQVGKEMEFLKEWRKHWVYRGFCIWEENQTILMMFLYSLLL